MNRHNMSTLGRPMVQDAPVQKEVMEAIRNHDGPMQPKEIVEATGRSRDSVNSALKKLKERGDLTQPEYGHYAIPRNNSPNVEKVEKDRDNGGPSQDVSLPLLSVSASASPESDIWEVREQRYMSVNRQALQRDVGGDVSQMAVVPVTGDSMLPSLRPGDKVVIERSEFEQIVEGVVYVWRGAHHGIIIKRAQWKSDDCLQLVSDAEGYPTIEITVDDVSHWECVGRVTQVLRPM